MKVEIEALKQECEKLRIKKKDEGIVPGSRSDSPKFDQSLKQQLEADIEEKITILEQKDEELRKYRE